LRLSPGLRGGGAQAPGRFATFRDWVKNVNSLESKLMNSSEKNAGTAIDPKFLEMLVCPLTHTVLEYDRKNQELVSNAAKLVYPIRDGIPILLPSEARPLED
jgi:uncharacterized protein YbaR (Trm112 family)